MATKKVQKKAVEKSTPIKMTWTGDAWSSDDNFTCYFKMELTKQNAERLVKLMDLFKGIIGSSDKSLDLYEIVAWDDAVQIYEDDDFKNEVLCDVCKVRVSSNGVMWELKNKYNSDIYETEDVRREEIEEFIKRMTF